MPDPDGASFGLVATVTDDPDDSRHQTCVCVSARGVSSFLVGHFLGMWSRAQNERTE